MMFFSSDLKAKAASEEVRKKVEPSRAVGKVSQTLTLPGGRQLRVMREDAYRAALAKAVRDVALPNAGKRTGTAPS